MLGKIINIKGLKPMSGTINIILGADNVGKTTLINNSTKFLKKFLPNSEIAYKHFSAPKPGTHALDQYKEYLCSLERRFEDRESSLTNTVPNIIFLDRAWPESKFYESYRRNDNSLLIEECLELEKEFLDFAEKRNYKIRINLLYKPWSYIEKFHIEELINNKKFAQESAIINNEPLDLMHRKNEHEAYYRFMDYYIKLRQSMAPDVTEVFPMNSLTFYNLDFVLI